MLRNASHCNVTGGEGQVWTSIPQPGVRGMGGQILVLEINPQTHLVKYLMHRVETERIVCILFMVRVVGPQQILSI